MKLYIASTSGYSGKTLLALGLSRVWSGGGVSVGYVKPLGKIPVVEEGRIVDGDALFLAKEMGLPGPLEDVCPVVITQDLVMAAYRREPLPLRERVGRAVEKAASRVDILLLGGAANLSDGFFLGLSPLDIISSLDCRVLLVDRFTAEESMDQLLWTARILGDRLLGVVLNRVAASQEAFVRDVVRPYIEGGGTRFFGAIPADPVMESVSVAALAAALPRPGGFSRRGKRRRRGCARRPEGVAGGKEADAEQGRRSQGSPPPKSSGFSLTSPLPLYTVYLARGEGYPPIQSLPIPYFMPTEETKALFKMFVLPKLRVRGRRHREQVGAEGRRRQATKRMP